MTDFRGKVEELHNLEEMAKVRTVSPEEVKGTEWFGPVYHGSSGENRQTIGDKGFKIFRGLPSQGNVTHGYPGGEYANRMPPPIHHLGYAVYFTTNKTIAKRFNQGTASGLQEYYLKVPSLETINFGSPNTMMKWWLENGYTGKPGMSEKARLRATASLTKQLSSQYDAVWFKGKGLRTLLDGDQIAVYDPKNIFAVDNSKSAGYDNGRSVIVRPGDRVLVKDTRVIVKVLNVEALNRGTLNDSPWEELLWSHDYTLATNMTKKQKEQIVDVWQSRVVQSVSQNPDSSNVDMVRQNMSKNHGREVTTAEAAEVVAEYQVGNVNYRLPIALVDRVLKPRERLK